MKHAPLATRSSWSRIVHSPLVLIVCVCITVYMSTVVYAQWQKEREWNARVVVREEEVRAARELHETLQARVAYAESESGKEAYIRQSFDVAASGETLIILPETKQEAQAPVATSTAPAPTWWQRVTTALFD